jgi:hypothetical protein
MQLGGLADARFPRRWKVSTSGAVMSTAIAMLTGSEPLLIERPYRTGRVILSTVPLDNSWRTNLTEMPAFVPLAHELIYYLAGARSGELNLSPGQPIRFRPTDESPPGLVAIQPPDGEPKTIEVKNWPLTFEDTREPGIYSIRWQAKDRYYVVQPDPRESQLALGTEEDRKKVSNLIPNLTYAANSEEIVDTLTKGSMTKELWLLALAGVFLLFFGEIIMTRRMAKSRLA